MEIFAHRGASAYAPQNTVPAFRKAIEMGCDGIELDIQLTSDGVPVVFHDFVLDRRSDKRGFVHRQSWKEIREADAGSWFSSEYAGTPIPSLEEVLALTPSDMTLNIEIKALDFLEENIARILRDLLAQDSKRRLIISSFNHRILKEIHSLAPEYPLGILLGCSMIDLSAYIENSGLKPFSIHQEATHLTPALVGECREKGWKLYSYTINSAEQAEMAGKIGTDGIFTDYPDLLSLSGF